LERSSHGKGILSNRKQNGQSKNCGIFEWLVVEIMRRIGAGQIKLGLHLGEVCPGWFAKWGWNVVSLVRELGLCVDSRWAGGVGERALRYLAEWDKGRGCLDLGFTISDLRFTNGG
jgi:hypothetical protein